MLAILTESLAARVAVSVFLAAACAYLYWKIQKRKRLALEAAKKQETPESMLASIREKFFSDDEEGYKNLLRSEIGETASELDVKHVPEVQTITVATETAQTQKPLETPPEKPNKIAPKTEQNDELPEPAPKPKQRRTRKKNAKRIEIE